MLISIKVTGENRASHFEGLKKRDTKQYEYYNYGNQLIAIYDKKTQSTRIYPSYEENLFYYKKGNFFVCSNDLNAILNSGVPKEENKAVVAEFLSFGYVMPPFTLYKNIFKMSVFEMFEVTLSSEVNLVKKHNNEIFNNNHFTEVKMSLSPLQFLKLKSTDKATLLFSGGMDSCILCELLKNTGVPFNSISTGFEFDESDLIERDYALSAAEALEVVTKYESYEVDGLFNAVPLLIKRLGEPLNHLQTLLLYGVLSDPRSTIEDKIVCGQGADAVFGTSYQYNKIKEKCKDSVYYPPPKYFNFLPEEYIKLSTDTKKNYLSSLDMSGLDADFFVEIDGDAMTTLNSWTKLFRLHGKNLINPFYTPENISLSLNSDWEDKLSEKKALILKEGLKLGINKKLLLREKASFGPRSTQWANHLEVFNAQVSEYFESNLLSHLINKSTERYTAWNLVNYCLWKKLCLK